MKQQYSQNYLANKMQELDKIERERIILLNDIAMYGYDTLNFPLSERYINLAYEAAPKSIEILLNKAKIDAIVNPNKMQENIEKINELISALPNTKKKESLQHLNFIKAKHFLFFEKWEALNNVDEDSIETVILKSIGEAIVNGANLSEILQKRGIPPSQKDIATQVMQFMLDGGFYLQLYDYAKEIEKYYPSNDYFRNVTLQLAKLQKLKLIGQHSKAFTIAKTIFEATMDQNAKDEYIFFLQATRQFKKFWKISGPKHIVNIASAMNIPKLEHNMNIDGKTLLIVTDQGFGDNIQNSRYIKAIIEKYPNVNIVFSIFHQLQTLFVKNFHELSKVNVIDYSVESIQNANPDYYIFFSEMPKILNLDGDDMERLGRETKIDVDDPIKYEKPTIGIFWKTTVRDNVTRTKNIDLETFIKLVKKNTNLQDFDMVSLAKEDITEEERKLFKKYGIKDVSKELSSFYDTARFIKNLDEVHSIDTAVVHLAGAMHKKAFCYINRYRDWRWGDQIQEKTKSYLYPDLYIVDNVFRK